MSFVQFIFARPLTEDEIHGLRLGLEPQPAVLAGAVKLMLLTAQRRGDVLRLWWEDVAEEAGMWWRMIPAEHAKNGMSHRVPLSSQAAAIVAEMRAMPREAPWVQTRPTQDDPYFGRTYVI